MRPGSRDAEIARRLRGGIRTLNIIREHLQQRPEQDALTRALRLASLALGAKDAQLTVLTADGNRVAATLRLDHKGWQTPAGEDDKAALAEESYRHAVLKRARPMVVGAGDKRLPPKDRQNLQARGVGAVLAVPLLGSEGPLGLLELYRPGEPREFRPEHVALGQLIGNEIATGLERWRLLKKHADLTNQLQRSELRLRMMQLAAQVLRDQPDAGSLLSECGPVALEVLGADALALYLLQDSGEQGLRLVSVYGDEAVAGLLRDVDSVAALISARGRASEPGIETNLKEAPATPHALATCAARGLVWVPVRAGGQQVGVLAGAWRSQSEPRAELLQLVWEFAGLIGVALDREEVCREVADRVARSRLVARTSHALNSTLDLEEVVRVAGEHLRPLLPCQGLVLALRDKETGRYQVLNIAGAPWPIAADANGAQPYLPFSLGMDEYREASIYVADTRSNPHQWAQMMASEGVLSFACLPLHAHQDDAGCLVVWDAQPASLRAEHLSLLEDLAPHLAAALVNAQLHRDLQQAYEELQAAQEQQVRNERLRILGQMGAGISHDFNNLLAVVLGQAQLGLLETQDEKAVPRLKEIEAAALQAAASVRRLSEFAGRPGGETAVETSVQEVSQQALEVTRPRWRDHAEARGASIRTRLDIEEGLMAFVAPDALRDVLVNLILNAAEAIEGDGEIIIRGRRVQDRARISIEDTGMGMDPQAVKRALEPFYSTRGPKRLGIGLPVAQAIVTRYGGNLTLESEVGVGTIVTIDLPVGAQPPTAQPSGPSALTGRVVVVEDNEVLLGLVRQLLSNAGFDVQAFSGGHEAIEACRQQPPAVLFTDLGMAEMSGWDVASAVRDIDPTITIVMLTGWGGTISSDEAKQHGVDFVVAKPIDSTMLINTVRKAMDYHQHKVATLEAADNPLGQPTDAPTPGAVDQPSRQRSLP